MPANRKMDGSTCFHRVLNDLLYAVQSSGPIALWKYLHPSEDGEALRMITPSDSQQLHRLSATNESEANMESRWFAVYTVVPA